MRDPFDLPEGHEGLSHADPTRRAQIQMHRPLPKRFYEKATIGEDAQGYSILLDGRPVKTPAKNMLAVPTKALAEIICAEWSAQVEVIDPLSMPVTRLANTAIDGIAPDRQPVFADILKFSESDMLCYRAETPAELMERQARDWDPVLEWAAKDLGAHFILAEGVMPAEQPPEAVAALAARLRQHDSALELAALHTITTLTGSALLALAFASRVIGVEEAWRLAHLEEDWTNEHWGADADAELRRTKRYREMQAAASTFEALQPVA
ncbi:ATP12 family chaperone protein [Rhizobium sp. SGZ-381]|uniref:ATP12 family chaperone protein n=1 Tax=Rhizobium sp. SGZ-381 TaxID=3342800 RepID=UPI0036708F05